MSHLIVQPAHDTMAGRLAEPLLPADASSRDLEACASAPVAAPMHRLTGTFEDLALEAAFAALAFRDAFFVHVGLLAVATAGIGIAFGMARDITCLTTIVVYVLTLIFRVYLHQYRDAHTAQKLGSASWTIGLVILVLIDSIDGILHLVQQEPSSLCPSVSAAVPALTSLLSSH